MQQKALKLSLVSLPLFFSATFTHSQFVEGQDYIRTPVVGKTVDPKIIEVREFFWYGCGFCNRLEPHLQSWIKRMPSDVTFARTPAPLNPIWEVGARSYYVSEALGIRKKNHLAMFHEIHNKSNRNFDQASQAKFFTKFGIPEAKFNSLYNSFPITAKVAEAKKLTYQYQLEGVPAVVVNGKYIVSGADAKVTQVIDYLIEKERDTLKNSLL
ncbi:thiol:disulfide interchange protein DsbA/DsbL [Acinetobacter sichuanensis]|uniref:thiol:disulfide interchange protein DsbA/DsbL n=1 Tax=Acinetobacter sichuanensis TaxID=2136183 RepID=UPI002810751B|nr:thiol:disulfide interchange protein DsbA/DsbL [Acinetobacter sichuanensis]MDQ9019957.1 thiol:disulfide interchange protein DsbA/DsbL [Acinetobacter sichuanensis]